MSNTLVIQSHRSPLPYSWLNPCLESVRHWCQRNKYDYQFLGDELFDHIPKDLRVKIKDQPVIASDLARLNALLDAVDHSYETVMWMDADFLIFDPENFRLPEDTFAVGREVWIQAGKQNKLKVYKKVHNAFLMFRRTNSFLQFYAETAERLLMRAKSSTPPQFVGPKLLTALHNIVQLPVMEAAGMLSPPVVKSIVNGVGAALDLFIENSSAPITGANLCISSCSRGELSNSELEQLIEILLSKRIVFTKKN